MNPNSAIHWFPKINAIGLLVPRTIFVPYDHQKCLSIFDGVPSEEFFRLSREVDTAAQQIGFPVFIRTDLSSAKHSGPSAYRIDEPGYSAAIFETLEFNEMVHWMSDSPRAFMVREWLNLESYFTAFRGLKISQEWRYFSDGEKVLCSHPYWPLEALEEHVNEAAWPDWHFDLGMLQEPTGDESSIEQIAITAASACQWIDGERTRRWSVDFCRDIDGKIWLTDMASMEDSWHWPDCPNGERRQDDHKTE